MKKTKNKNIIKKAVEENAIHTFFNDWTHLELTLVTYERGEYVQLSEEKLDVIKFCISGEFEVSSISPSGKYFIVSKETAPNIFGDMEFASGSSHTTGMNAVALTEIVCLELPLKQNRELLLSDNTFLRFMCHNLGKKALESSSRYEQMAQYPPECRLSAFLLINAPQNRIDQHLGEACQLLGISYRHMMRLLHEFCERGILKNGQKKGHYIIVDRKALEQISMI